MILRIPSHKAMRELAYSRFGADVSWDEMYKMAGGKSGCFVFSRSQIDAIDQLERI